MTWSEKYNQYVREDITDNGLQDIKTFNSVKDKLVIGKGTVLYDARFGILYQALHDIVLAGMKDKHLIGFEPGSIFSMRDKRYVKSPALVLRNMEFPTRSMLEVYSKKSTV